MSDIFREVDEAMQQDKMLAIWNEYKNTIILGIACLLITSTGTTLYKNWNAKRNAAETNRLMSALEAENPQNALQEIIKDTRKNHKALGLLSAAHLKLKNGQKEDATAMYQQIATDKKSPRNIRDLARVLYVQNTSKPDIKILQPLLSNNKSPWIWHARIEAAVITVHDKQDYEGALYYLEDFNSDKAKYIPASLKQRAQALSHVYTLKSQMNIVNKTDKSGE